MKTPWRIQMFATLKALHQDRVFERFRTYNAGLLLARLAFYPHRAHTREELLELFWPDEPSLAARNNLRQTLYALRHLLEPDGKAEDSLILSDNTALWVNPHLLTTDVAEFEVGLHWAARREDAEEKITDLTKAVGLYAGDLLNGFYAEWVQAERGRLEMLYGLGLGELIRLLEAQGRLDQAVGHTLKLAALNPFEESGHLAVMRLYGELGQPELARKQYREMERVLRVELQARPSREASDLLAWIEKEAVSTSTASLSRVLSSEGTRERRLVEKVSGQAAAQETPLPDDYDTLNRQVILLRDGQDTETPAENFARRRRQAQLCIALAEMAWAAWYGDEEEEWLRRLEGLKPDIEAALRWLLDNAPAGAVQIAGALTRYWYLGSHSLEGLRWQKQALAHSPERTVYRARALVGASWIEGGWWQKARLQELCTEALDIYREQQDLWGQAHAIRHLGLIAAEAVQGCPGDYRLAMQHLTEAQRLFQELNDKRGQAVTLLSMAYSWRDGLSKEEMLREKVACGLESLKLFREVGNAWGGWILAFCFFAVETKRLPCDSTTRDFYLELRDEYRIWAEIEYRLWTERQHDLSLLARSARFAAETLQIDLTLDDLNDALERIGWFSQCAIQRHDYRRAARLLGAYLHRREKAPHSFGYDEAYQSQLRAKLGDRVYQSCLTAGSKMTWEQVIAETLPLQENTPPGA